MRDYQLDLIERLQDTEYAEMYLNASLESYMEDQDIKAFLLTLEHLARAKYSIKDLAKQTGISRQHLYRIFDNDSKPNFMTILQMIDSLGFSINIKRKA